MAKKPSHIAQSSYRKKLMLARLRQATENRRYKKDVKTGLVPKRGLPMDLRSESVKLQVLNRYVNMAQGHV